MSLHTLGTHFVPLQPLAAAMLCRSAQVRFAKWPFCHLRCAPPVAEDGYAISSVAPGDCEFGEYVRKQARGPRATAQALNSRWGVSDVDRRCTSDESSLPAMLRSVAGAMADPCL